MHYTRGQHRLISQAAEIKKHHNRMEHAAGHPIKTQPTWGTLVEDRNVITSGATQPTHFCLLPGHKKGIRLVPLPDPIPLEIQEDINDLTAEEDKG
jgi:hypothetical protein